MITLVKVVLKKLGLLHFTSRHKTRLALEKRQCSSLKMYFSYRSWLIIILVLHTQAFGEALTKTSKIHDLFI